MRSPMAIKQFIPAWPVCQREWSGNMVLRLTPFLSPFSHSCSTISLVLGYLLLGSLDLLSLILWTNPGTSHTLHHTRDSFCSFFVSASRFEGKRQHERYMSNIEPVNSRWQNTHRYMLEEVKIINVISTSVKHTLQYQYQQHQHTHNIQYYIHSIEKFKSLVKINQQHYN